MAENKDDQPSPDDLKAQSDRALEEFLAYSDTLTPPISPKESERLQILGELSVKARIRFYERGGEQS